MADLDTQLLNRENINRDEEVRASSLNRKDKQRKRREKNQQQEEGGEEKSGRKGTGLKTAGRQLSDTAKRGVKNKAGHEAKEYTKKKVAAPARMYTSSMLKWSWIVLIPSWGLSLVYINIHAFMHLIMPSLFCKLGEEWVPAPLRSAVNQGSRVAGIVEKMVLVLADLLALFIVFLAFVFIALIAYLATETWQAIMDMGLYVLKPLWEMLH